MRYASIRKMDIINGEGIGVSLFLQGCPFHCKGCFNQETWDFNGGKYFTNDIKNKFIELCSKPYINFISILGGEPLAQSKELYPLLKELKQNFPNKKIFLWTGFTWESIMDSTTNDLNIDKKSCINLIKECVDVLIDGQFLENKKDLNLYLRGSTNQRIWRKDENGLWNMSTTKI